MKIVLILMIAILSLSTFACPDLNGSYYRCTTGDRVQDVLMGVNKARLKVVQNGKDISAIFMGKTTTIKVDEIVELENYSQRQRATIYSKAYSTCQNDILNIDEQSRIVYDSGKVENESSLTDIYMKIKKIHMDITQTNNNGDIRKLNIVCKRKP